MPNHTTIDEDELGRFLCSTLEIACSRPEGSVTLATELIDLGMDSFTLVSVLAQAEAVYEFDLNQDEMLVLSQATRVVDLLEKIRR